MPVIPRKASKEFVVLPEIALGPLFALAVGILSLFYDKNKSKNKWLLYVLLISLIAVCSTEIYSKSKNKLSTDLERDWNKKTISGLTVALKNFRDEANKSLNDISGLIVKQKELLNEKTTSKNMIKGEEGWAYYGLCDFDNKFAERYFSNTSDRPDAYPKINDIVVATERVNTRRGYIKYINDKGWVTTPVIGTISPEEQIVVLKIQRVFGYVWVQFKRLT